MDIGMACFRNSKERAVTMEKYAVLRVQVEMDIGMARFKNLKERAATMEEYTMLRVQVRRTLVSSLCERLSSFFQ